MLNWGSNVTPSKPRSKSEQIFDVRLSIVVSEPSLLRTRRIPPWLETTSRPPGVKVISVGASTEATSVSEKPHGTAADVVSGALSVIPNIISAMSAASQRRNGANLPQASVDRRI